jgi:hypothetical protein
MITDELGECPSCGATGLYKGFAEPEGHAVICHTCGGGGGSKTGTKPFTGRKRKPGIRRVLTDGGLWFTRTGNTPSIPVEEFYEKVPESKN